MPSCNITFLSPLLRSYKKGTGILPGSDSRQKNKKQFRTAQLHIQQRNPMNRSGEERAPGEKEGMLRLLSFPASLTVEAAIALPVFFAAMCIFMFPLKVLDAQASAQREMEYAAEVVAVAEGVGRSTQADTGDKKTSGLFREFDTAVTGAAILKAFDSEVFYSEKRPEFSLPDAQDPMIKIQVTGLVRFPFMSMLTDSGAAAQASWKLQCPVKLITSRRAWVGRKGGYGRSYGEEAAESGAAPEAAEDRTVYVAQNSSKSSRYHVSADCHYISNDMVLISRSEIGDCRNKSGGKYHACPSCHPDSCDMVYYFKSGSAYHSSLSCKAIGAYVTEMKESEAKERGLTPCSYCGRTH